MQHLGLAFIQSLKDEVNDEHARMDRPGDLHAMTRRAVVIDNRQYEQPLGKERWNPCVGCRQDQELEQARQEKQWQPTAHEAGRHETAPTPDWGQNVGPRPGASATNAESRDNSHVAAVIKHSPTAVPRDARWRLLFSQRPPRLQLRRM